MRDCGGSPAIRIQGRVSLGMQDDELCASHAEQLAERYEAMGTAVRADIRSMAAPAPSLEPPEQQQMEPDVRAAIDRDVAGLYATAAPVPAEGARDDEGVAGRVGDRWRYGNRSVTLIRVSAWVTSDDMILSDAELRYSRRAHLEHRLAANAAVVPVETPPPVCPKCEGRGWIGSDSAAMACPGLAHLRHAPAAPPPPAQPPRAACKYLHRPGKRCVKCGAVEPADSTVRALSDPTVYGAPPEPPPPQRKEPHGQQGKRLQPGAGRRDDEGSGRRSRAIEADTEDPNASGAGRGDATGGNEPGAASGVLLEQPADAPEVRRGDEDLVPAPPCRGCGKTLDTNNYMADGCPCNSPRGVNHGLVPVNVCTCEACDPEQTGSIRRSSVPPREGTPVTGRDSWFAWPGCKPWCGLLMNDALRVARRRNTDGGGVHFKPLSRTGGVTQVFCSTECRNRFARGAHVFLDDGAGDCNDCGNGAGHVIHVVDAKGEFDPADHLTPDSPSSTPPGEPAK